MPEIMLVFCWVLVRVLDLEQPQRNTRTHGRSRSGIQILRPVKVRLCKALVYSHIYIHLSKYICIYMCIYRERELEIDAYVISVCV